MRNFPLVGIYRYKRYVLALLSVILLVYTNQLSSLELTQLEQARSADSFVDSIGIVTHLRYRDTAYGNYNSTIKPRLQELEIRHIRDGGKSYTFYQKLNELATVGIKSTLVMDPRDGTKPVDALTIVKTVSKSIEAVEGPNETDLNKFSYNGKLFPEATCDYQNQLYTAIKGDSLTASVPVLQPSMGWGKNITKLRFLTSFDMGNMHSYPANGAPPTYKLDSWYLKFARIGSAKNKPMVVTETGYHNAVNNPLSSSAISEQASSKYLSRLLLEYFNRSIKRTFIYELINEKSGTDQEQNFGLLRYDGSPKPAFIAIKNLILLLKDPGSKTFPLKTLDYSLYGNTTDVHHTLLQKRNGKFYLIVWQEVHSWDTKNKKDRTVPPRNVTLKLNTLISQAALYQPINSITPIRENTSPEQLELSIPDHPLVIELVPN
jgi:hypothetical protein